MFDALAKTTIDPRTGKPFDFSTDWSREGQRAYTGEDGNLVDPGFASDGRTYSPEFLQSIGFSGQGMLSGGEGQATQNPELTKYLADQGLTLGRGYDGGTNEVLQRAFNANGEGVGNEMRWSAEDDPGNVLLKSWLAMAGGFGAGTLALGGAGAAGAAGEAAGSGIGADSLAYGALENGAAYGGGFGSPMLASAGEGGLEALGSAGAAGGGAAADAAGMGLAEGAYPASLGGAGGGGLLSSLGSAASDAGSWMQAHPGLTNIGGSLLNAGIGAYSANQALNAQKDAAAQSNALWKPYNDLGANAVGRLNGLMQNPGSITQDPGYQFGMNQGTQAIDHSAASKGGLYSGATQKALARYGQDYAGTKLNDAYTRYGNVAQLGATGTTNLGNNALGVGNAGAGAAMYTGNTAQNALNSALGNFNYQNALSQYGQSTYGKP